jgi:hypothetical protein
MKKSVNWSFSFLFPCWNPGLIFERSFKLKTKKEKRKKKKEKERVQLTGFYARKFFNKMESKVKNC